jgi:activator of HSP90 ATPase
MIHKHYEIKAPIKSVWDALTNPDTIEKWSGADAQMTGVEGDDFSLWDGDIWGTNTQIITNKLIRQDWFGGKWDVPSYVEIHLSEADGATQIELTHERVPQDEEASFSDGWDDYYFGPIQELLER